VDVDNILAIKNEDGFIKKGIVNKAKPMRRLVNNSNSNKNVTYNVTLLRGNDKTIKNKVEKTIEEHI